MPALEGEVLQLKIQLSLSNAKLYQSQQKLSTVEAKFADLKEELSDCKREKAKLQKTLDKLSTPAVKPNIDSENRFYLIHFMDL